MRNFFFGYLAVVSFIGSVQAQANGNRVYAPLDQHIRDVSSIIQFEPRNCNSYSVGGGVGCMFSENGNGQNIVKIGGMTPCRPGGTVQLDFTNDFYLLAATCGSSSELIEKFTKTMNASYGPGKSKGSKRESYVQTAWDLPDKRVTASETSFGSTTIYKVTVMVKP